MYVVRSLRVFVAGIDAAGILVWARAVGFGGG
jgi:hypothetical protein